MAQSTEAFQFRVDRLVQAYREQGHLYARLDPIGLESRRDDEGISLGAFGLSKDDLDLPVANDAGGERTRTLREVVERLRETYCRTIGVELAHLHDRELSSWLEERMERTRNHITLTPDVERLLLRKLTEAESFEQFLGTRFLGAKRFSLEGAEGLIPMLELILDRAVGHGVKEVAIGMAHRGRLNALANVVGKPARQIFAEFRDRAIIASGGDVKYHLGYQAEHATPDGVPVQVSLAFNPSHLEWINTVVQGKVRARQDRARDSWRGRVLPVLVHGDAAFAGQGIVAECLNMAQLEGYNVGGTIHIVVNNQVGFTTSPRDARSTFYATDVARMLQVPVFHVNGEDLEAIAQTVLLAVDFRQRFHSDAVIDLWCYRKYGHNEGDEPAFTQPLMYRAIAKKPSLRKAWADHLVAKGVVSQADVDALSAEVRHRLEEAYAASAAIAVSPGPPEVRGVKANYRGGDITGAAAAQVATAVDPQLLQDVGRALTFVPPGFNIHPKIAKLLEVRAEMVSGKRPVDWGMGEALALGTLAWEGVRVRLSGQDVRRGTFSHRHAVLVDQQTGKRYSPLEHLRDGQGTVEVWDSPLSEAGVLGFEYGYSLEMPDGLTIWEAQFGDFVNAAQVIIDQFLSSSEAKWGRLSGLVMLLPHGMEGQGPEHSSARLERFLELSVDDNWQVMNLTTPAQLFHALRRQVLAPWRKPLVVMSPKSLLRHPAVVSPLSDFTSGSLRPFIVDEQADPGEITRVVLCSGKMFYELAEARAQQGARNVALIRLEQLYPLEKDALLGLLSRYREGVEVIWAQEEPQNMGAWTFVDMHLARLVRERRSELGRVARAPSASPAAGSTTRHRLEQQALVNQAIGESPRIAVAGATGG
jgi:2-oxoglutarate dehydrogenase E1 component